VTSTAEETALRVVDLAREGRFADIRERFAGALRPLVTADTLRAAWEAAAALHGPLTTVGVPAGEAAGGGATLVRVPLGFERGELTLTVAVTGAGQLGRLELTAADGGQPSWPSPPYADPRRFEDQEVTLGTGPLAVGGTLSLPRTAGPVPALVLLGGSGPQERDGTIAQSKPLRDVAEGLASRGIAVLRFDKVTYAHPDQVRADPGFTLADEYLPHALAALRLLAGHPPVDATRIFVGGHSLGATIAPRVAAAAPASTGLAPAGLVLLAAGAEPMHRAAVRQYRYLAALDPARAAEFQPVIDAQTAAAALVDGPSLTRDTPASQLPFGVPAPYWLDVRGYDPVATAAALRLPVLLVQGGRDYQVTLADDLARWQAGLAGSPGVTVRVYEADNHFFFPGTGPSRPAELAAPQHVDPAVVRDIADWLAPTAG
jgi:dienelactone hydrolase